MCFIRVGKLEVELLAQRMRLSFCWLLPDSLLRGLFSVYFREVWLCKVAAINDHTVAQSISFRDINLCVRMGKLPPRNFSHGDVVIT